MVTRGMEDGDPEAYLEAAEGYVEAMFEGERAGTRPVFEKVLEMAHRMGPDRLNPPQATRLQPRWWQSVHKRTCTA